MCYNVDELATDCKTRQRTNLRVRERDSTIRRRETEQDLTRERSGGLQCRFVSLGWNAKAMNMRTASFIVDSFAAVLYARDDLADSRVSSSILIWCGGGRQREIVNTIETAHLARHQLIDELLGSDEGSVRVGRFVDLHSERMSPRRVEGERKRTE